MIYGIGTDIIDIRRIKRVIDIYGVRFKKKCFHEEEIEVSEKRYKSVESYAKRYAAKEAFSKAIGIGISKGISFKEITVENLKSGKPSIRLYGNTKRIVNKILKNKKFYIYLSLSDDKPYAVATAVISV